MTTEQLIGGFLLIFVAVFICGWKIGNYYGWREGFRIAKELERQRIEGAWLRGEQMLQADGDWDYQPKDMSTKRKGPQV